MPPIYFYRCAICHGNPILDERFKDWLLPNRFNTLHYTPFKNNFCISNNYWIYNIYKQIHENILLQVITSASDNNQIENFLLTILNVWIENVQIYLIYCVFIYYYIVFIVNILYFQYSVIYVNRVTHK